jgi:hypothetical protein
MHPRRLSDTLPGTWELLSRSDRTDAGEARIDPALGEDPVAWLIYDRAGHFAAQFMKRDRAGAAMPPAGPPPVAAGGNNTRAQDGYDAYFGTYTVDESARTVTQKLLGALSAENVGQTVTRAVEIANDKLTIRLRTTSLSGEPVTRTLQWRRIG